MNGTEWRWGQRWRQGGGSGRSSGGDEGQGRGGDRARVGMGGNAGGWREDTRAGGSRVSIALDTWNICVPFEIGHRFDSKWGHFQHLGAQYVSSIYYI